MPFNPNAPAVIGAEWRTNREGIQRVDSSFSVAAAVFDSSVTETIDQLGLFLTSVQGGYTSFWELEIYDLVNLSSGAAGQGGHAPDTDAQIIGGVYNDAGTGNMWSHIDDLALNTADWIGGGFGAPYSTQYQARFANIAGAYTGKIINSVSLGVFLAADAGGTGTPTLAGHPLLLVDGWYSNGQPVSVGQSVVYNEQIWPINPASNVSWKVSDVEKLDTDTDSAAGWFFDATGSVNFVQKIYLMTLIIRWGATERRVAVGTLWNPNVGLNMISLQTPTGTDNWAKVAGHSYLILLRRTFGNGSCSVRWLDSGKACPHHGHRSGQISFLGDGRLDANNVILTKTPAYSVNMLRSDAAASVDSQPYSSVNGDTEPGEGYAAGPVDPNATWTMIDVAHAMQAEITPTATANYSSVLALVRSARSALPTQNLVIQVKRRSDNVTLGSALTITPAELLAPYRAWRLLVKNLTSAASLVSGLQYYFDVSCSSAIGQGWEVQVLSTVTDTLFDATGFGGTIDQLTYNGLQIQHLDAVIAIAQSITNVTSFAAAAQNLTLASPSGWMSSITTMQKVHLTWIKTSYGASFRRYEIDRLDPWTSVWSTIAQITNENTQVLDDVEARVGFVNSYRIRVIHVNDAASDWSSIVTATPAWGNFASGLLFVSNESLLLSCGFLTQGPTREYAFLNAETAESHRFQGRDYQVVFRDLEERGLSFDATVFINLAATPARRGEPLFQALRDVADASLSYVAVKNKNGEVWYASVLVHSGIREEPENYYESTVTVIQTTAVASIVDANP